MITIAHAHQSCVILHIFQDFSNKKQFRTVDYGPPTGLIILKMLLTIAPRPVSKHASSSHNTRLVGGGVAPRGWWHIVAKLLQCLQFPAWEQPLSPSWGRLRFPAWEDLSVRCLGTFALPAWDACQFPAWDACQCPAWAVIFILKPLRQ